MPGLTRPNFARFCAVSSSRWARTQALASIADHAICDDRREHDRLAGPVGATPSVLPCSRAREAALDEEFLAGAKQHGAALTAPRRDAADARLRPACCARVAGRRVR
jgi:hypothetical protein